MIILSPSRVQQGVDDEILRLKRSLHNKLHFDIICAPILLFYNIQ